MGNGDADRELASYLPRQNVMSLQDWNNLATTGRQPKYTRTPLNPVFPKRETPKRKNRSDDRLDSKHSTERSSKIHRSICHLGWTGPI